MFVHCYISIEPIGTSNASISKEVAECVKIFKQKNLSYQVTASGTDLEGEFNVITDAIESCHKRLHEIGCIRVHSVIKMTTRTDKMASGRTTGN